MNDISKKFLGVSLGQAIIFITQVVAIVWFAAGMKSDVRDLGTRMSIAEKDVIELKIEQTKDREIIGQSLSDLKTNVGILLERTRPKPIAQ